MPGTELNWATSSCASCCLETTRYVGSSQRQGLQGHHVLNSLLPISRFTCLLVGLSLTLCSVFLQASPIFDVCRTKGGDLFLMVQMLIDVRAGLQTVVAPRDRSARPPSEFWARRNSGMWADSAQPGVFIRTLRVLTFPRPACADIANIRIWFREKLLL